MYGGIEKEYNINDNHDHKVVGIAMNADCVIKDNFSIQFTIPDTNSTILSKKQFKIPVCALNTQRNPKLQKFNY